MLDQSEKESQIAGRTHFMNLIDMQQIGSSDRKTTISQFVDVSQIGKGGYTIGPNKVIKDPANRLVTVTLGPIKRRF